MNICMTSCWKRQLKNSCFDARPVNPETLFELGADEGAHTAQRQYQTSALLAYGEYIWM